jgi:riboflavin kinase / FMN adenylyltransferase
MRIIRDVFAPPPDACGTVLALGNFDGVHLGHQAIFNHTVALAKAERCPAAVMTFEPHPRQFFSKDHASMRIYPFRRKAELIAENRIDLLLVARFNQRLAATPAESFIKDILHEKLRVRHVVTGYNFAFGKGRSGNTEMLSHMAESLGFGFTAHQPVYDEKKALISSSRIRKLLEEGKVKDAAADLGRPYQIEGRARRGMGRGTDLGFPTANISLSRLLKPRFGIYAVRMKIGREIMWRDAVASIGVNPTFSPVEPVLEVHCFDIRRELYSEHIHVEFVDFIREERKFETVDALKTQMNADCIAAKNLLKGAA